MLIDMFVCVCVWVKYIENKFLIRFVCWLWCVGCVCLCLYDKFLWVFRINIVSLRDENTRTTTYRVCSVVGCVVIE